MYTGGQVWLFLDNRLVTPSSSSRSGRIVWFKCCYKLFVYIAVGTVVNAFPSISPVLLTELSDCQMVVVALGGGWGMVVIPVLLNYEYK